MDEQRTATESHNGTGVGEASVRFGPFEWQSDKGGLCKSGSRVRLQRAPLHILQALLQQPGHVVTRDELRSKVWAANAFGDFESGLNTAINRLRAVLGDSAENPIYIETLPRIGYRFIAPVTLGPLPVLPSCAGGPVTTTTYVGAKWGIAAATIFPIVAFLTAKVFLTTPAIKFRQITFSRGLVHNARFLNAGKSIVYDDAVNGRRSRLFLARSPEDASDPTDLGFDDARLAGVSTQGSIAISRHGKAEESMDIETVPLNGHTPRKLSSQVGAVDWSSSGTPAFVTWKNGAFSVEFPPGHAIYSSRSWLSDLRVSPRGDQMAFVEHPFPRDDAGQIMLTTVAGKTRVLSANWESVDGLAWSASGREVWFTAARSGVDRNLMAVDLNGSVREVAQLPGGMLLRDISAAGDVLIVRAASRMNMLRGDLESKRTEDISWLDWSSVAAISADGKQILFDESGQGGGSQYSVYLYNAASHSAQRLGDGRALDLSGGAEWALTQSASDLTKIALISTADRKAQPVSPHGFEYRWAKFIPGGDCPEILFAAGRLGEKIQLYRQKIPSGAPTLVAASVVSNPVIDRTGHFAAGFGDQASIAFLDLTANSLRLVKNPSYAAPVVFANDGRLLTARKENQSLLLEYFDRQRGVLAPYRRLDKLQDAETAEVLPLRLAADLQSFAYSRLESTSSLFAVSGWR